MLTSLVDYQKRSIYFRFLNNKLSISIPFEKVSVPNGQTALAGLVFEKSCTEIIQK